MGWIKVMMVSDAKVISDPKPSPQRGEMGVRAGGWVGGGCDGVGTMISSRLIEVKMATAVNAAVKME